MCTHVCVAMYVLLCPEEMDDSDSAMASAEEQKESDLQVLCSKIDRCLL